MSETNADLENALQRLAPAPAAIDRDRLMFLAGKASRSNGGLAWKLTSGIFAAGCVVLALLLVLRPPSEVRVVKIIVPQTLPQEKPVIPKEVDAVKSDPALGLAPDSKMPELAYYRLQQQVLRFGEEALPPMSNPGGPTNEPPITVERLGKSSPTAAPMNLFNWP
jgi:hypothetical protein